MELHHVKNQTEDSADIFLFNQIGNGGINATDFVNELRFLDTLGLESINVRINSGGGSVIEGYGIFSAIRAINTPVNTIIEGIAASIAGVIAMAGTTRSISDFGRLMIHDPSFGASRPNNKQQAALDSIKDSLKTILSNNSSLDLEEISELMSNETWFNAEDAKAFGFVDEVFSTQREVSNECTILDVQNIANDLHDNNTNLETTINNMLDIKNHLSLNDEATEGEVLEAVKTLENNVVEATNKVEEMETAHAVEIETLNNAKIELETVHNEALLEMKNVNDELITEIATLVVENAIEAGKFDKSKKESLVEQAIDNLEGFKNIIESVNVAPTSITSLIENNNEPTNEKTWDDYQKGDSKGLANLMVNDKETYNKLYFNKYGVNPNN